MPRGYHNATGKPLGSQFNSRGIKGGKTGPKAIQLADQVSQWIQDRASGMQYEAIAQAHRARTGKSISRQAVWAAVDKALLAVVREPAEHLRALELQRLDELQAAYWKNALLGDIQAAMFVLRVLESRRKLEGLDKAKSDGGAVTVNVGAPMPAEISLEDIKPLIEAAGYEVRPKLSP